MKTFQYKGYNESGQAARGLIEAHDLKDARDKLRRQGILTHKVEATTEEVRGRREFDLETRALMYRELASLLKAGLPLDAAFQLLINTPELQQHGSWTRPHPRSAQGGARTFGGVG